MAKKKFDIRESRAGDAKALQQLLSAVVDEDLPVIFARQRPTEEEQAAVIEHMNQSTNSVLLVAESGDRLVGMLALEGRSRPQMAHIGYLGMCVASSWRGRGVGSALLAALVAWVEEEQRVSRVELEVFDNNPRAVKLYRRFGFELEGTRRRAVNVGDRMIDMHFMARIWPHPVIQLSG